MAQVEKERAPRNRTLSLSAGERDALRERLFDASTETDFSAEKILGRTILGDVLRILPELPSEMADLIVVDPPYNLDKDFNGNRFRSMSDADYEAYLDSWMGELSRILSKTGTIYVCGDWKSSLAIQRSL